MRSSPFAFWIIKNGVITESSGSHFDPDLAGLLVDGIEMFDIDPKWNVNADFIKYEVPRKVEIPNITGTIDSGLAYGKLVFSIDGGEHSLEPLGNENRLFLVFADMTNGEETYGAGRFLSVGSPDSTGKVKIDFNKAYNPPCVFTKYATCPLPNKNNVLKIKVTAGEKNFHSAYH